MMLTNMFTPNWHSMGLEYFPITWDGARGVWDGLGLWSLMFFCRCQTRLFSLETPRLDLPGKGEGGGIGEALNVANFWSYPPTSQNPYSSCILELRNGWFVHVCQDVIKSLSARKSIMLSSKSVQRQDCIFLKFASILYCLLCRSKSCITPGAGQNEIT